jgi:GNAT superfamily N-acetyltransferase
MEHEQTNKTLFADIHLAWRLENVDAVGGAEYARAHARLFPHSKATSIAIAGGRAVFAGVESPITQAVALGMSGEVTSLGIDELEEFYRSRDANVNIEVCPLADISLVEQLAARGYKPIEFSNVLARFLSLNELNACVRRQTEISVRLATAGEAEAWGQTAARGFMETMETANVPPPMRDLFTTIFHTSGTHCFIAEQDGVIIGGGSMNIRDGIAALAGASTLPAYRKRGAQGALLDYRLQFAMKHGCDLATVATLPGSASQRNAERNGFRVAYTRTKWLRQWAS